MATNVQHVKNTGFYANLWIFLTNTEVSMYFIYIFQAAGLLFGAFPWFLLSKVVSSELDPLLAGEGVVNWQFWPL